MSTIKFNTNKVKFFCYFEYSSGAAESVFWGYGYGISLIIFKIYRLSIQHDTSDKVLDIKVKLLNTKSLLLTEIRLVI